MGWSVLTEPFPHLLVNRAVPPGTVLQQPGLDDGLGSLSWPRENRSACITRLIAIGKWPRGDPRRPAWLRSDRRSLGGVGLGAASLPPKIFFTYVVVVCSEMSFNQT